MVTLTPTAVIKIKEIMAHQNPIPVALRVGVAGGGCSGFQYRLVFDDEPTATENDTETDYDGLRVRVDNMSAMYLEGCVVDFVDSIEGVGFKFDNPNVKTTCGCGSSFSV